MSTYEALHLFILLLSVVGLAVGLYSLLPLHPLNLASFYILVYSSSALSGYWWRKWIDYE